MEKSQGLSAGTPIARADAEMFRTPAHLTIQDGQTLDSDNAGFQIPQNICITGPFEAYNSVLTRGLIKIPVSG